MDLKLQKKKKKIKVSSYHPNDQDKIRQTYMQNGGVFIDLI